MRETYFLASSAFALPLPFALAFFSPLAFLAGLASAFGAGVASFFASVPAGALGAVSDFGACANAVNANAEAINATSSFFIGVLSPVSDPNADLPRTTPGTGLRLTHNSWHQHDHGRLQGARARGRIVGVRLWLAHVVALLLLRREAARAGPRLPPGALHPLDALPRHAPPARAGHGALPRRLLLGHGVSHRGARSRPLPLAPVASRDAATGL